MNILVTGACGNIGSHTVPELLKRGHRVASFDLKNPRTVKKAKTLGSQSSFSGEIYVMQIRLNSQCKDGNIRGPKKDFHESVSPPNSLVFAKYVALLEGSSKRKPA